MPQTDPREASSRAARETRDNVQGRETGALVSRGLTDACLRSEEVANCMFTLA